MISPIDRDSGNDVLQAFRDQAVKAGAAIVLCVAAAVIYTAIAPVYYSSEAKIFVRLGRESVELDPTVTTGQFVSVQDARENEINSVFETLTSRAILESVVNTIGPEVVLNGGESIATGQSETASEEVTNPDGAVNSTIEAEQGPTLLQKLNPLASYSRRDDAIQRLSQKLSVTNAKKSNIITISCEGQTPEVARKIVERVIESAREAHMRVNRIAGSLPFFTEQADAERRRLAELELALCQLKNQSGVASFPQQRELQLKQLGALEDELQATDRGLRAADAETHSVQERLSNQPTTVVTAETTGIADTAAARMREQLYALQIRHQELASKLTAEHPQLVQIENQIAQAQAMLDHEKTAPEVTKGENKTYKDLEMAVYHSEASAESLRGKQRLLNEQLAAARAAVKSTNELERQLASLERDIDVSRQNYRRYTDNLEQARIGQELASQRISNINVLQPPTFSYTPVRPRTLFNLTMGFALGMIAAVAIVAFGAQRRQRSQYDVISLRVNAAAGANGSPPASQFELDSHSNDAETMLAQMGFQEVPETPNKVAKPRHPLDGRRPEDEGNGRISNPPD